MLQGLSGVNSCGNPPAGAVVVGACNLRLTLAMPIAIKAVTFVQPTMPLAAGSEAQQLHE
jgi:hypothetical protein